MCACVFVCMCVCVYVCMFVCVYVCMCVCVYVWMCVYECAQEKACVHTWTCMSTCMCVHVYVHVYVQVNAYGFRVRVSVRVLYVYVYYVREYVRGCVSALIPLVVSVLPVPAGPSGAPPSFICRAPIKVRYARSVRGVTTRREETPRYS